MTTETIETSPAPQADPEPQEPQTETPATEVVAEGAAAEPEAAAVSQVEVVAEPEKPDYMTRADWEREKAEVAKSAAADALELDRRRRQTENARREQQEKRDREDYAELVDTAKSAFGAAGIYEVPEQPLTTAVDRMIGKRAGQITNRALDSVGPALSYLGGETDELDAEFVDTAERIRPALQAFVDRSRDLITTKAREGYFPESDLPKYREQWAAEQAAKSREGKEELKRVDGVGRSSRTDDEILADPSTPVSVLKEIRSRQTARSNT